MASVLSSFLTSKSVDYCLYRGLTTCTQTGSQIDLNQELAFRSSLHRVSLGICQLLTREKGPQTHAKAVESAGNFHFAETLSLEHMLRLVSTETAVASSCWSGWQLPQT